MTVYVDDTFIRADVPNGASTVRGVWCHMQADTREELDAMADRIGLRRSWIQYPGTWKEHYDVTKAKRALALKHGAVELPIGDEWIAFHERKKATLAAETTRLASLAGAVDAGRPAGVLLADAPLRPVGVTEPNAAPRPVVDAAPVVASRPDGESIRVLITGSREFSARPVIAAALTAVAREHPGRTLTVVHGAARGADMLAGAIARDFPGRLVEERHPVTDWKRPDGSTDRAAGHRRNQRMVDAGAAVCLAFLSRASENRGTRSCMAKAAAAGIDVREFWGD